MPFEIAYIVQMTGEPGKAQRGRSCGIKSRSVGVDGSSMDGKDSAVCGMTMLSVIFVSVSFLRLALHSNTMASWTSKTIR